jgi:hypothetical protein
MGMTTLDRGRGGRGASGLLPRKLNVKKFQWGVLNTPSGTVGVFYWRFSCRQSRMFLFFIYFYTNESTPSLQEEKIQPTPPRRPGRNSLEC